MNTKIVVIGGVAGGATAAARARRISESAEITVVERGPYVSYANCGLPYFISRDIEKRSELLLQTPEGFDARYGVRVLLETEAIEIDRSGKRVLVRAKDRETWLSYDKLILAQGGNPITPAIPGVNSPHVFKLWTVPDMDRIHAYIENDKPRTAVVVGGGFIGLEMAEALHKRGLATTVVELLPSVMSTMDPEIGHQIAGALETNGVTLLTSTKVESIVDRSVAIGDGRYLPADLVLFSVGVRPELGLARKAGLEIGSTGGLLVDEHLRTFDPDIYAAGDMLEIMHRISGRRVRVPLAGPANRQGRIAASNALGLDMTYRGALGTSAVKIFETTAAMTGLSEHAAREAGFDVGVAVIHKGHHAGYYPGAEELSLKLIYDKKTARLIGAGAFGPAGVDKRIDVLATALAGNLTLHDLAELDLAYAPPYSTANDPVNLAAFIGLNDLSGFSPLVSAAQLKAELAEVDPPLVLDVRTLGEYEESHLAGSMHVPLDDLRFELERLPNNRRIVVHCRSGFRAHLAVRILKQRGFTNVANVTGGQLSMLAEGGFHWETL
jgi:NADPH-dependent 2,4-dienoyl-CoA reductase/sulfur reductase-like enzyme/rhodanese-related sulfurtransferase